MSEMAVTQYPYFTFGISCMQVICYILFASITDDLFVFKPTRRLDFWRYFTIALVHNGEIHLISNLVYQLFFGISLEKVYGWRRVSVIFFSGTFFGELLSAALTATSDDAVGASAGVLALSSAYIASVILNPHLRNMWLLLLAIFNCFGETLMIYFCKEYFYRQSLLFCKMDCPMCPFFCQTSLEGDSFKAHSAGSIIGILVGFAVLKPIGSAEPWKITVKRYCSKIVALILTSVTILSVIQH